MAVLKEKCIMEAGNVQSVELKSQIYHLNQIQPDLINFFAATVIVKR
jgi:hypothetical protein